MPQKYNSKALYAEFRGSTLFLVVSKFTPVTFVVCKAVFSGELMLPVVMPVTFVVCKAVVMR